jgi:hypothetical protein
VCKDIPVDESYELVEELKKEFAKLAKESKK